MLMIWIKTDCCLVGSEKTQYDSNFQVQWDMNAEEALLGNPIIFEAKDWLKNAFIKRKKEESNMILSYLKTQGFNEDVYNIYNLNK